MWFCCVGWGEDADSGGSGGGGGEDAAESDGWVCMRLDVASMNELN